MTKLAALVGTWGRPPDTLAKAALATAVALAILAVLGRGRSLLFTDDVPRKHFLRLGAFVAAMLSLLWIAVYLRGGPRIVDATTYFLQGRALSEGDLAWKLPEPSASFRGRFLVVHDGPDGPMIGGIFPPGYPLLLALGFTIGAPMVVGPVLAGALVFATYHLARAIAEESLAPELVEPVARVAALFSIASAALRYHTADTMSHGATALAVTLALGCALRGRAALAGLCLGWVLATRPVSALPVGVVVVALLARGGVRGGERRGRVLAEAALGLVPGALLLLASQKAVTGSWLGSTQRMYYALSDGPPGCFRYGFGEGIGCLHEHGEFVRARLADGYGLLAATGTTLRRLKMHLLDVANLEPLALLVLVPIAKMRSRAVIAATTLVGLQVLAYAPFYFDGNYPAGGARFFADVLPVEHVLVTIAIALLARAPLAFARAAFATLGLALAGFAVHASFDHRKLADRDGGTPMFDRDLLAKANAREGLVYVDTDHGFSLGHDPDARTKDGIVVARLRGDDRDRLLFDRLDRPPTWLYRFETPPGATTATPALVPWAPPDLERPLRFEAEAEWPPLAQEGGFAVPGPVDGCASKARALILTPVPTDGSVHATIAVPVPEKGRYRVALHVVFGAVAPFTEHLVSPGKRGAGSARIGGARWEWPAPGSNPAGGCLVLPSHVLELEAPSVRLDLEARGGTVALDRVTLERE